MFKLLVFDLNFVALEHVKQQGNLRSLTRKVTLHSSQKSSMKDSQETTYAMAR